MCLKIANFVMLSILKLKGSKKKEMLNRLLTPALEMKERQEKYEFVFLLIFLHVFNDLNSDLTSSDIFLLTYSEFDRLGYEKLIEMAYEKSKVSSFLWLLWVIPSSCFDNFYLVFCFYRQVGGITPLVERVRLTRYQSRSHLLS